MSQRLHPTSAAIAHRKVIVPGGYRFAGNGSFLPEHSLVSLPAQAVDRDPRFYKDPEVFDGFRFAKPQDVSRRNYIRQSIITADTFLSFGHGRHLW